NGHFMVVIDSLNSTFQAAHFHEGGAGVNGDVLFDITPFFIEGNAAFGYWMDMGDAAVAFRTDGVYMNVHTTDFPGGEIRGDYLRTSTLVEEYPSRAQLFVSSNTQGNMGVLDLGYSGENNLYTFPVVGTDADGIYFDKESDRVFQVNRSMNRVDVYSNTLESIVDGLIPNLALSSSSDFTNGRELTAGQGRIIVAQDANDANGQQNKLVVYTLTESGLELESSFDVDINLWGIQLQGDRLWAIVDNSSDIAWYDDIFSQTSGSLMTSGRATVEGLVRTHGLDYNAQSDLMVLTDVGAASSATDGAIVVVNDFSSAISDNMISADEQTRLEGDVSELGNPVDCAIDPSTTTVFVAERANAGGKILAFDISDGRVNHVPVMSENYAGASAVYLSSTRTSGDFTPFNPQFDGRLLFTGRLSGGQEVPSVQTDATGVVGILLNTTMDRATVNLSVNGLTGNFAGVHLHEAPAGDNGGVVVNLTDDFISNRISTEIDISPELLDMLMAGNIYINVHTDAFPDGELRAQVLLEKDLSYVNWITGDQEVPAVQTNAIGLITANLTQVLNTLEINAYFKDLSSHVIGAHLHMAVEGENGGVVADLSSMVNGQSITGSVDVSSFIDDLKAGNIYLNIHTENNPGGEIRAQLNEWSGITADGWIAGEQSVPANITPGLGLTAINLSPDRSMLTVWAVTDDLSGDIAAAHLHLGEQGANGGVWVNVSDAVVDGNIQFSTSDFDAEQLTAFLSGGVYLNVHTADFPDGEIRAQVYPLTRDAYNYSICQEQETGAVINATTANGGGIVSLDRKGKNIHLMAVASGLSGPIIGVHLHEAAMDEDGPVILNLGTYLNNGGVFFYYTSDDFNTNIASPIREGNVYINVHTDDNPAGEIRGQIIKSLECPISTSTEFISPELAGFTIIPNPANAYVDVQADWDNKDTAVRIINTNGQLVKSFITQENMRINIQDLTPGIYYINLSNEIQTTTHKMVKL
ncbi:MAG: CHRD domain-containing protein, partial [Saprospiraceae bacterium]|nr:CHRD domain-containing protein [Saprospiraceae bacterium]